jgi:hypothetical protein
MPGGITRGVRWKIAWEVTTDLTRVPLPTVGMFFFQYEGVNLEAALSIRGCTSMVLRPQVESGSPRYFIGKFEIWIGKLCVTSWRSMFEHVVGAAMLLWTLVTNPVTSPKPSKICARTLKIFLVGSHKDSRGVGI